MPLPAVMPAVGAVSARGDVSVKVMLCSDLRDGSPRGTWAPSPRDSRLDRPLMWQAAGGRRRAELCAAHGMTASPLLVSVGGGGGGGAVVTRPWRRLERDKALAKHVLLTGRVGPANSRTAAADR